MLHFSGGVGVIKHSLHVISEGQLLAHISSNNYDNNDIHSKLQYNYSNIKILKTKRLKNRKKFKNN